MNDDSVPPRQHHPGAGRPAPVVPRPPECGPATIAPRPPECGPATIAPRPPECGPAAVALHCAETPVAEYVWQPDLPRSLAPRPYLHPVRTLAGTPVTEAMPTDHRHHLGVSVGVPDLAGHNFWGGRTFVPARGPAELDNHGHQRHEGWISRSPSALVSELTWLDPTGGALLRERRALAAVDLDPRSWVLDWAFTLTNTTVEPLAFASPATNGRPGSGYAGFFWRVATAVRRVTVAGPDGRGGERGLHGRPAAWLAVSGTGRDRWPWTLIFLGADDRTREDRWFVHTGDYVGVGSSLAWDRPLVLQPGAGLRRRIITVVVDGLVSRATAEVLGAEALRVCGSAGGAA